MTDIIFKLILDTVKEGLSGAKTLPLARSELFRNDILYKYEKKYDKNGQILDKILDWFVDLGILSVGEGPKEVNRANSGLTESQNALNKEEPPKSESQKLNNPAKSHKYAIHCGEITAIEDRVFEFIKSKTFPTDSQRPI